MEAMTIKQNDTSTSNNVKMSGMPRHTTRFLPLSLNHARPTVILCVGTAECEGLYDIPSLGKEKGMF